MEQVFLPEIPSETPTACECGSTDLAYDPGTGEWVCRKCGLVLAEIMSRDKDWQNFEDDPIQHDRATPIFDPNYVEGSTNSTRVPGYAKIDGLKNKLKPNTKVDFLRLSKLSSQVTGENASTARPIIIARQLYDAYKTKLAIPDRLDVHIFEIFIKAVSVNLIRGRSIQQILIACMYHSLRENGIPTTLVNIQDATGMDKKDVARCYFLLVNTLKLKNPRRDPAVFISQFASKLNLTGEFEMTALDICRKAQEKKTTNGSSPLCVAACSVYLASKKMNLKIPQKTIAKTIGVTDISIRNQIRKFQADGWFENKENS